MIRVLVLLLLLVAMPWVAEATFPTAPAPTPTSVTSLSTTHNIAVPACAAGNLLIMLSGFDVATTIVTWPTGANVTTISLRASTGSSSVNEIRYRFANGSDATLNVTTDAAVRSEHLVWCWSSAHPSQPPEAPAWASATTLTPDPPASGTASWGSADNIFLVALSSGSAPPTFVSCPTNYTTNCITGLGLGSHIAASYRALAASSDDPGVFTFTGSAVSCATTTVIIRPADAAATTAKGGMLLRGVGP